MKMEIGMEKLLKARLTYTKSSGSLLGFSPLELELILKNGLGQSQGNIPAEHAKDEMNKDEKENYSNYFYSSFRAARKKTSGEISREQYLKQPQIIVTKEQGEYRAECNHDLERRLDEKLDHFQQERDGEEAQLKRFFIQRVRRDRKWITTQQKNIAVFLCTMQEDYLRTGSPFDLLPINQENIALYLGHSSSAVSRLMHCLTIQLPDDRVVFAEVLTPGSFLLQLQGTYALRQLRQDPQHYDTLNEEWKIDDVKLTSLIRDQFGLHLARRTVTKYRHLV